MTPLPGTPRRFRIGLSANLADPEPDRKFFPDSWLLYAEQCMAHMVAAAGALTYLVPPVLDPSGHPPAGAPTAGEVAADLDGLVLTGGADLAPATYGQEPLRPQWAGQPERDAYELDLVRAVLAAGKPVLGICRGLQLLNVALGGTLYQDIAHQTGSPVVHRDQQAYQRNRHSVDVVAGSALSAIYDGATSGTVISVHHQAICDLATPLVVEATSRDDGIIEAVRLVGDAEGSPRWAVGVQWHPELELLVPDGDASLPGDEPRLGPEPLMAAFMAAVEAATP